MTTPDTSVRLSEAQQPPQCEESTVTTTARLALSNGISVVPAKEDGSKAPALDWKQYQSCLPDQWLGGNSTGLFVICGAVSGNLEMLEWESKEAWDAYWERAEATGMASILHHITSGYLETSPGGGYHTFYRCSNIEGNLKLAMVGGKVAIETRGEGGGVVVAPSHGKVHPTGNPYVLLNGGFDSIIPIHPDDRERLHALARSFDESPPKVIKEAPTEYVDSDRPGDIFNRTATWEEILEPHGWTSVFRKGTEGFWRRAGKDRGISATTNYGGSNLLHVFTSSTEFNPDTAYSKFTAYTILEHAGDFRAAAAALADKGYKPIEPKPEVEKRASISLSDLLVRPAPSNRWVIPDFLERGDRMILTGEEGEGKSTWLRQVALMCAIGINPFNGKMMEPQHVLLLDTENSMMQIQEEMLKLLELSGSNPPPFFSILSRPEGMDLDGRDGWRELESELRALKPDLLIGGPMYKMVGADLKDEKVSKRLSEVLDGLRVSHDCAMLLEAHQIQEIHGFSREGKPVSNRPQRPYGHSLWRRWPEYGYSLLPDGTFKPWRGDRQKREWPARFLKNGRPWLWGIPNGECQYNDCTAQAKEFFCCDEHANRHRQARYRERQKARQAVLGIE